METMAPPPKKQATPPWHQHLPDELIEDILARMPAKSVLRCRCLSRAWSAALSSYAFVDRHLDLANRRRSNQFPSLCFLPDSAAASTVYAWTPEHGKGVFTPLMAVRHNTRNGILAAVTRPCRGLFLLRSVAARLYYLCNPSVGQITAALPDGRMPAGHRCPGLEYASFGLGYDARARAHKVVRLLYHDSRPTGCDIYDVPGAGHWRPAAGGAIPPEHVRMNQMGVFVQGHVHWVTMTAACGPAGEAIVSSMAGEEFGHVAPLPVAVVEGVRSAVELVVPVAVDEDGRVLLDTGKALGYYDARSRSLETVCSLKSKLGDRHGADDLFFIAAVSEDSLFRPYDRSCRLW